MFGKLVLIVSISGVCLVEWAQKYLNVDLSEQIFNPRIEIYDSEHKVIGHSGGVSEYIQYEDIPEKVIQTLIATEDVHFWEHSGLNWASMFVAVKENIISRKIVRGGSTITQQLAKTLLFQKDSKLISNKTQRKILEIFIALKLEHTLSKKEILEKYLNKVYFGRGAYGIASAAKLYFNKDLVDLNIYETAFLIGLIQAPSRYAANHDQAISRTKHVLKRLHKAGFISRSIQGEINLIQQNSQASVIPFIHWVKKQIPQWILDSKKNIKVYTTLDTSLQQKVIEHMPQITKASRFNFTELSMIATERDGGIKVMIGGIHNNIYGFNRATNAFRQAGSIFKIYTFLAAFLGKWKPEDTIDDTPPTIGTWTPRNYYHFEQGFITLEEAFARSVNGATVRLAMECKLNKIIHLARLLGVTSALPYEMSIILGSGLITLYQITQTLLIIANNGFNIVPYAICQIRDADTDTVMWSHDSDNIKQLINNPEAFQYMIQLMHAVVNKPYGTGRAAKSKNYVLGGKTGTSQNYTDLWFSCFSNHLIACAWCGNDNNTPMIRDKSASKVNPVVAICKYIMEITYGDYVNEESKPVVEQNQPIRPESIEEALAV